MYHQVAIDCFRYFGFTSFDQVDRLTIYEYNILIEAENLKQVDRDYRNHLQAYLNFQATAKKNVGKTKQKPVFDKFIKFFDYDKAIKKVQSKKSEKGRLSALSKFLKERRADE